MLPRRTLLKAIGLGGMGVLVGAPWRFPTACAATAATPHTEDRGFAEFTSASIQSLQRASQWLLRAINKDGGVGVEIASPSEVACSSVVGLSLLAQGHTSLEGEHRGYQRRLLEFVLSRIGQSEAGGALQNIRSQIEGDLGSLAPHFFAALYLAESMGESPDLPRIDAALKKAERTISSGQLQDGSWGTDAWAPMLGTAVGWLSLRAISSAGLKVSASATKTGQYLIDNMPRLGSRWGSQSWYHRFYGTAAGLRVLYAMQMDELPKAQSALQDVMNLVRGDNRAFGGAGGEEYLTFHLLTEMLMQKGGDQWQQWYTTVRNKLIEVQNRDGSWTGHHCITSRVFSTACASLVLAAPNRYLPISHV